MKSVLILSVCVSISFNCAWSAIDLTTPTGGVISWSESHDSYPGTKAFDDGFPLTTGSRWLPLVSTLPDAYVTYAFNGGVTHVVQAYKVWNMVEYSVESRAPKAFNLQGSSNGVDWVVLDTRFNETGWGDGEARLYVFTNTVPYSHFKFNIMTNNGATDYTGLSELELFESASEGMPPAQAYSPSPADAASGVSIRTPLSWAVDFVTEEASVYFGTNAVMTQSDLITNTTDIVYDPGLLEFESTYYWRVDSSNQFGVTTGVVWSFTTGLPDPINVAYDGFEDYSLGLLNGQGVAADGWTMGWTAFTTGVDVVEESLSYKNGGVHVDGGSQAIALYGINRADAMRRIFTKLEGPVVYFSALVQRKAPILGSQLLSVGLKNQLYGSPTDHTVGFDFGYPGDQINAEIHSTGEGRIRVSTGVTVVSNETYFIVTRLKRTGDDMDYESAEVLVNPSTATEPESGWTQAVYPDAASEVIDKINVRTYFMEEGEMDLIDEIRIGTTYEAVVPKRIQVGTLIMVE